MTRMTAVVRVFMSGHPLCGRDVDRITGTGRRSIRHRCMSVAAVVVVVVVVHQRPPAIY